MNDKWYGLTSEEPELVYLGEAANNAEFCENEDYNWILSEAQAAKLTVRNLITLNTRGPGRARTALLRELLNSLHGGLPALALTNTDLVEYCTIITAAADGKFRVEHNHEDSQELTIEECLTAFEKSSLYIGL